MRTNLGCRRRVAWLGVACLGLLSPLLAQQLQATLKGHTHYVLIVAYSPDGKTLASASADQTIKLWDVASGRSNATLKGHTDTVSTVAFTPDGKLLASGSNDKSIKVWDMATGKEQATLKGHTGSVLSVSYSPDGKTLASASADQTIKLWDVASGKEQATLRGHTGWVSSVAYSTDGKLVASGSEDKTIKLWEVASGKELIRLQGQNGWIYAITFSPDGKTVVSGSEDETVRMWEVATGKELSPGPRVDTVMWILVLLFFGFVGCFVANSEGSNFMRLAFIPLYPLGLLAGIIGIGVLLIVVAVLYPVFKVKGMIDERKFRTLMKSQRRLLDGVDLRVKLEAGEGTLIEETGHKGPYRVWWTDDNVLEKGTPISTDEDFMAVLQGSDYPFNSQCLKEYLDPNTGKAFLTSIPPKHLKSGRFSRTQPRMTVVMVVRPFHIKP